MDGEIVFDIHLKTTLKRNRKVIALILKNILNNDSVELKTNFALVVKSTVTGIDNRELKQPPWQQKPHKFAYLTMENSIFARFARAFFHLLTF